MSIITLIKSLTIPGITLGIIMIIGLALTLWALYQLIDVQGMSDEDRKEIRFGPAGQGRGKNNQQR